MKIKTKVIPVKEMRYPTLGDYYQEEDGTWVIVVAETGDEHYNQLILIHELVEIILTQNDGISEPEIMAFDIQFEKTKLDPDAEPGNEPDAPYHEQHVFAEIIERMIAQKLGVNWQEYERDLNKIEYE
jgi:hypothetical protein